MSVDSKGTMPGPTDGGSGNPGPTTPGDGGGSTTGGCQPCDLEGFDGLACRAKRYEKQAEIMTQVAINLATYKTQYGEARTAFADAWETLSAEREEIQTRLDEIYELLTCRLSPGQKECLDKAAEEVFADVDECLPDPGCCVGECEFDDEIGENDDVATLTARIEKYRRDTEANTACFTSLVGEVAAITGQVTALKAEVTALAADVTASTDKAKLPRWYARWLIATRGLALAHLGHGFTSASAYSDCLCKTLQCIAAGWAAIAVLEGTRAEMACLEGAERAECERRAGAVLQSILEVYECCMEEKDEPECPKQGEPGQSRDAD